VGIVVLALKWAAFRMTGSVALYSDALESVVNIVAAILALLAIRISAKPPDANHPYGHSKVEYLSAVTEGAMIVLAALLIMQEAYDALLSPRRLEAPAAGLAVNAAATLLNAIWAAVLIRYGARLRSPALAADGRHLMTDVITSAGVVLGLLVAQASGWAWLDPGIALLVAVNVLWSGWVLMRSSIDGLMDAAPEAEVRRRVEAVIAENGDGALQAHDLRMRQTGQTTFVEFHLIVPGKMTVSESHAICDRIETALAAELDGAAISIHVEPDSKGKSGDGVELGTG
jgi:cation diffusion facilitator family transporter